MKTNASAPLARLREQHPAPRLPRILVHCGTAGNAMGATRYLEELRIALGDRSDSVVEAASDGANWAAPAATVAQGTYKALTLRGRSANSSGT